jgi:serine/threonine protein kinase
LLNLHALKIIHFDIKLENIAFSPAFDKYVFIDFGLSKIIRQSFGFKSLTSFRGTYSNCSPEMAALSNLDQSAFVDLYYNDNYAFRSVLKQL